MRIARRNRSSERNRALSREIAEAALARGVEGRVCGPECTARCTRCGSTSCQCSCAPRCPEAPRALSADPANHPIEPAILPLVYEMKRLTVFTPCWSCEGHLRPDGSLWKVPRVWFYCESMVHVRLLTDGLGQLKQAGRLSAPWQIVVTYSDPDNPDTTFSLEPALQPGESATLRTLQEDVTVIARMLESLLGTQARKLQRESGAALASGG